MAATKSKAKKTKAPKKKRAARNRNVTYKCSGGCIASPNDLHVFYGDTVVMKASGTGVKVKFGAKSPFRRKTFNIPSGGTDRAKVVKRTGTFNYRIACDHCPAPALPPRIIID